MKQYAKWLLVPLFASQFSASAADWGTDVSIFLGAARGGDEFNDNLSYTGKDRLEAGSGYNLGLGVRQGLGDNFLMQTNATYLFGDESASDGESELSRYALDVIGYYKLSPNWQFGLGLAYHLNIKYKVKLDAGTEEEADFDNALGYIASIGYEDTNDYGHIGRLELRYTVIDYDYSDDNATSTLLDTSSSQSANHVGLYYTYSF